MIKEAADLQKTADMSALALKSSLEEAKSVADRTMTSTDGLSDNDRVRILYINLLSRGRVMINIYKKSAR